MTENNFMRLYPHKKDIENTRHRNEKTAWQPLSMIFAIQTNALQRGIKGICFLSFHCFLRKHIPFPFAFECFDLSLSLILSKLNVSAFFFFFGEINYHIQVLLILHYIMEATV